MVVKKTRTGTESLHRWGATDSLYNRHKLVMLCPAAGITPHLLSKVFDTCLRIRPGDTAWIHSWDHSLDLAMALESKCTKRKCPSIVTVRKSPATTYPPSGTCWTE